MQLFIHFLFIPLLCTPFSGNNTTDLIVHEFHLSNTEVRYNVDEEALQITTRIFIDDLEESLGKQGHKGLYLCTEQEPEHAETLLEEYLIDNIQITVDEEIQSFTYLGKEISDDLIAVWCYMEILNITPKSEISVSNNVLLKDFSDQKNIVKIQVDNGQKKMFILENGKNSGSMTL